ncbi:MAG: hypothetical protein AAGF11_21555 [Myxococcota bacterium]
MMRAQFLKVLPLGVVGLLLLGTGCGDGGNPDDSGAVGSTGDDPTTSASGGPTTEEPPATTEEPPATTGEPSDDSTTGEPSDDSTTGEPEPLPSEIPLTDDAIPEDLIVYDGYLYVSNFVDASVLRVSLDDLEDISVFVPPADPGEALVSGWGLDVLESESWLLTIANAPLNLMGPPAADGEVRAYALADGSLAQTWSMPTGFQGNSIDTGPGGMIYIGDFGQPRIIRIDPSTDEVTLWKEDAVAWPPGGFGLGGMIVDNAGDAVYVSGGSSLWRVPINGDGSAGDSELVSLTDDGGADFVWGGADGMSQAADGSIYFAQNDAFTPGAVGTAWRVQLDDSTSGTISMVADGLADPSGAVAASHNGEDYLLINESQFGYFFGIDEGNPVLPYRVLVYPQS